MAEYLLPSTLSVTCERAVGGETWKKNQLKEEASIEYVSPGRGDRIVTGLVLVGLCAVLVYALVEHRSLKQLTTSHDELAAELNLETCPDTEPFAETPCGTICARTDGGVDAFPGASTDCDVG